MSSTHHLILASNSPRRQELLRQAGFKFEVFVKDFEEDFPESIGAIEVAEFLATQKNKQYRPYLNNEVIITADTTVVCEDQVLNKSQNKQDAMTMLSLLSDKIHTVVSGVCISSPDKFISFSDRTEVQFGHLSSEEIEYYIDQYHPFDKAGSYGIQEWIGLTKIESIKGSYFTVMGLPTHRVYMELMNQFGIKPQSFS